MSTHDSIMLMSRQMSTIQVEDQAPQLHPQPHRLPPTPPTLQSLEPLDPETLDVTGEEFLRYSVTLYQAALRGDCETVKRISHERPSSIRTRIAKGGETVLHIAAAAKHLHVVQEVLNHMSVKSLAMANKLGNTALCFAAVSGAVDIASAMVQKHKGLPNIRGSQGMTPLHMAVLLGHRQMVLYLLKATDLQQLTDQDLIGLLTSCIDTDLFDVALDILHKYPYLALQRDAKNETALHALARKPLKRDGCPQVRSWQTFKRQSSGTMHDKSAEPKAALELVQQLWKEVIKQKEANISNFIASPWRLLFVAARLGKVEFLTVLISSYPDLIWKVDENKYTIFHVAVVHRHEEIFKLIYEIGAIKDLIATYKDEKGNNMLHLASKLAPPHRLNSVSGAALQMQRELLWFEAVEKIVRPEYAEAENDEHKVPQALFSEEHEVLRSKGEDWMKKTAESCALVATLLATVAFSAAFQPPGSVEKGNPVLVRNASFVVFAMSNAISLFSSTASILMFLSILTSRYAERDFLRSLPLKLMWGLVLLLISIATMIVAFTTTFFIIFQKGKKWVPIPIASIAGIPATLFALQRFPLLFDIYNSVYGSESLLKSSKSKLFQLSSSQPSCSLYHKQARAATSRESRHHPSYHSAKLPVSFHPEDSIGPSTGTGDISTFHHPTASEIVNPMASGCLPRGSKHC